MQRRTPHAAPSNHNCTTAGPDQHHKRALPAGVVAADTPLERRRGCPTAKPGRQRKLHRGAAAFWKKKPVRRQSRSEHAGRALNQGEGYDEGDSATPRGMGARSV
ncbi:hypothetical protein MTO96_008290 [Rhipicephalus appendiculatus]